MFVFSLVVLVIRIIAQAQETPSPPIFAIFVLTTCKDADTFSSSLTSPCRLRERVSRGLLMHDLLSAFVNTFVPRPAKRETF